MRCGTFALPPDGTPDREQVDQFADFLRDVAQRGRAEVLADPAWRPYLAGEGPAPRPSSNQDRGGDNRPDGT